MAMVKLSDGRIQAVGGGLIILVAIVLGLTGFHLPESTKAHQLNANTAMAYQFPGRLPEDQLQANVRLTTNRGDILVHLTPDQAPLATSNFVYLVKQNFYNGIVWHRVEDWVVQAGDPQTRNPNVPSTQWGTGGPGYTIPDEPVTGDYVTGVVAMARTAAPNSGGSQFFILKRDTPLTKDYAIFGTVTSGMDIVDSLAVGDKIVSASIEPAS